MGQIQSVYQRQPVNSRIRVAVRGANHFTFSEDGALLKSSVLRAVMHVAGILRIGGRRQIEISSYVVRSFFDAWLKHSSDVRSLASAKYPELIRLP
jgi:hypothetical protein